jgi:hypothetical protein
MDSARERILAGMAELAVGIEMFKVRDRVERVDWRSTDRRIGSMLFQATSSHSVLIDIEKVLIRQLDTYV